MGFFLTEDGGHLLAEDGGHLLVEGSVTGPTIVGTWPGSYAAPSGFVFPPPSAKPLQVPVTNTATDWLFALVTWRPMTTGQDVSVCVADDAHNWWEPLGAPTADSGVAGAVRSAVWAAPAARVANTVTGVTNVQIGPTGPVLSLAVTIIDVAGILPWFVVSVITGNFGNVVSSLALSAGAPSASSFLLAAFGSDDNSKTVTGPSGWTALTGASATNGVDHTADIKLTPAYLVTSASSSASVSVSGGNLDLAGVIAGVLVSAPAPSVPSPNWPVMITEAAIGAGAQTPPSELTWTAISGRSLSMTMTQGRQYSLSQLSAGQGTLILDNPDGALIPPGTGPFTSIDSGTPFRRRVIIPAAPSPHYVAAAGYIRRWPWNMDSGTYRGVTQAETTDAWGYATTTLNSMAIEECQVDSPRSLWPLTDPAGSAAGSNLAPGNSTPLSVVTSKYGTGGATAVFGANSGSLIGASSAKVTSSGAQGGSAGMWQQALSGTSLAYNGYGFALQATDAAYPSLTGGMTAEVWGVPTVASTLAGVSGNGLCLVASAGAVFNTAQSNFPAGMPLVLGILSGPLPTPFVAGTTYFVTAPDGQGNYSLSATPGGSAITTTSSGVGTVTAVLAWDPVIMSLRDGKGAVLGLSIRNTDGALLLVYRTASGAHATVISTGGQDYRAGFYHFSLAATTTTYRVLVNAGSTLNVSGSFAAALPSGFRTACVAGTQDATQQGYACPGSFGFATVIPGVSPQERVVSREQAAVNGMLGDAACDRIERVLEYAGLAGRRWLGQQAITGEGDLCTSGQDVGGQAAASSCSNIAQSTLPAMLAVAPTGDIFYLAKFYAWNQPVRWTLGTRADLGEIPFRPNIATDYDPSRVVEDVQLTGLDDQLVTLPAGVMSSTTMAAVAAATERQYGGQAYQQTGYLLVDAGSAYTAGSSLQDLANWLATIYSKPANRIQSVTVEASANSANASLWKAWQFWAGVAAGDMVAVNVRVPTAVTSPLISLVARVTQTQRSSQFSQDGTSAAVTCVLDFSPEYNALTCDDPVRGLLNGSNVLPW